MTGYGIIATATILMSFIFYGFVFRFYGYGDFIAPMLLSLIPGMLFIFGVGMLAGRVHTGLIYVAMAAVFAVDLLPLPIFLNVIGGRFYSEYPLLLPLGAGGEPYFYVPLAFLLARLLISALGILMICAGVKGYIRIDT